MNTAQNVQGSSLATFATNITGFDVAQMPVKPIVDSDVQQWAQRLQTENPELAGYKIVQLANTWHEQPPDTYNENIRTATSNPFACSSSGPYSLGWNGNAPPNCDKGSAAGPFRGVFSIPGRAAAQAWIILPDSHTTMPTPPHRNVSI